MQSIYSYCKGLYDVQAGTILQRIEGTVNDEASFLKKSSEMKNQVLQRNDLNGVQSLSLFTEMLCGQGI